MGHALIGGSKPTTRPIAQPKRPNRVPDRANRRARKILISCRHEVSEDGRADGSGDTRSHTWVT